MCEAVLYQGACAADRAGQLPRSRISEAGTSLLPEGVDDRAGCACGVGPRSKSRGRFSSRGSFQGSLLDSATRRRWTTHYRGAGDKLPALRGRDAALVHHFTQDRSYPHSYWLYLSATRRPRDGALDCNDLSLCSLRLVAPLGLFLLLRSGGNADLDGLLASEPILMYGANPSHSSAGARQGCHNRNNAGNRLSHVQQPQRHGSL